jgi:glycine dehydrogenase subunit 2
MAAFHGQMGMFTRALTYILSHGNDGLRQVSEDAVLNANYILRALEDVLEAPFAKAGPACTRRCSRTPIWPRLLDAGHRQGSDRRGFHPMTVYFPLVVHGAMLIEPTETESRAGLTVSSPRCARWPSVPVPVTNA